MADPASTPKKQTQGMTDAAKRRRAQARAKRRAELRAAKLATENAGSNNNTEWEDRPLPVPVAMRGFYQIIGGYCAKHPNGIETIDELMAYARQYRQHAHGQKVMTAGAAA